MLAKKFAQNFVFIILSQALGFISSIFLARLGGAAIFGNIGLATSYQTLFRSLITNSTNNAHLKIYAEDNKIGIKNFSALSLFLILISDSLIFCWAIYNYYSTNSSLSNLQAILILLFILQDIIIFPSFIASTHCAAKLDIKRSNIISFIPLLLTNILKVVAVVIGYKEIGIAVFMLVASLFGSIYPLRLLKNSYWGKLDFSIIKKYSKYSLFITAGALAHGLLMSYDKILLGFLRVSPENIGYYNAGNRLGLLLMSIGVSVGGIFMAIFSKNVAEKNKDTSLNQLQQYERYILILFMPLVIGAILLGKDLLLAIFGKGFETGYVVLAISLIVAVTKTLTIPYHNLLFANNRFKLFNIIAFSYSFAIIVTTTLIGYIDPFHNILMSVSVGLLIAGITEKILFTIFSKQVDSRIQVIFHKEIVLFFVMTYLVAFFSLKYIFTDMSIIRNIVFVTFYSVATTLIGYMIGIYKNSDIRLFISLTK